MQYIILFHTSHFVIRHEITCGLKHVIWYSHKQYGLRFHSKLPHEWTNRVFSFIKSLKYWLLYYFQTRQPVFVQLLSAAFRVSQCHFVTLSVDQRVNVENCIRTLSEVAKARAIAIPSDLDMKVKRSTLWNNPIYSMF